MNALISKVALVTAVTVGLALTGCATQPYGTTYSNPPNGYGTRCQACGVVQSVQQIYINGGGNGNGGTLGAVIGAVAGGVLGSTIGKGDGRTAATVVGAVGGGVIGNQVGKHNDGNGTGWQIVVRLDNGQYATVTQQPNPGVRNGDYVEVRNGLVYPR
ncbi:MAG: glycine zipper 2TM domain-containing protein [Rhodanobacter sp.]